jgi:DNA-directed RNA polymerase specialized sigma subunit
VGITKDEMIELSELVAQSVVKALIDNGLVGASVSANKKTKQSEKSAYAKTEQLLYNYNGFKKIVAEKQLEIEELQQYGVPGKSAMSGGERVQSSRTVQGIVLPEESVENAVQRIHCAIQSTVQVISMIDKGMSALENDPYYKVLEMRYFEGRTLEDIGVHFNCDHSTISRNKSRLVKELALRFFPDEVVSEYMKK